MLDKFTGVIKWSYSQFWETLRRNTFQALRPETNERASPDPISSPILAYSGWVNAIQDHAIHAIHAQIVSIWGNQAGPEAQSQAIAESNSTHKMNLNLANSKNSEALAR